MENEDLCNVRSVSLRTEAASVQAEMGITDLEVSLRQGRYEEIIKSIDPGVYSEENMKTLNLWLVVAYQSSPDVSEQAQFALEPLCKAQGSVC